MVIIPEFGAVMLYSPSNTLLGWMLLGVGIIVGLFLRSSPFSYSYVSHAVVLYTISRDLEIHHDIVLIAGIPIILLDWLNHGLIQFWFYIVVFITHFWTESVKTEGNDWFPAVAAAHYLSFLPNIKTKILGIGLILLRHLHPSKVYFLYGCLLYVSQQPDKLDMSLMLNKILRVCLFFIMASENWFSFVYLSIILFDFVYK